MNRYKLSPRAVGYAWCPRWQSPAWAGWPTTRIPRATSSASCRWTPPPRRSLRGRGGREGSGHEIDGLDHVAIQRDGLHVELVACDVDLREVLHFFHLQGDAGDGLIHRGQGGAAAARHDVMHAVLQVVLVIVVVSRKHRRHLLLFEQRYQGRGLFAHVAGHLVGGDWRVVHYHETEVGLLVLRQVVLQPTELIVPKAFADGLAGREVVDIAVEQREVGRAPVEGIIGGIDVEEIVEAGVVAFVVAQDGEEHRLAKHLAFDVEKHRPLAGIVTVGDQVAGVENEIGVGLTDRPDNAAMQVVARTGIAEDDELEVGASGGCDFAVAAPLVDGRGAGNPVIDRFARLQPGHGDFPGLQYGNAAGGFAGFGSGEDLSGFRYPADGGAARGGGDHVRTADQLVGSLHRCQGTEGEEHTRVGHERHSSRIHRRPCSYFPFRRKVRPTTAVSGYPGVP